MIYQGSHEALQHTMTLCQAPREKVGDKLGGSIALWLDGGLAVRELATRRDRQPFLP